jgi:hypothetical protein
MTLLDFKIPEKDGEFLCIPSPASIHQLIQSNKEKMKAHDFNIEMEDVHCFRKKVREKIIRFSINFTSELAVKFYLDDDTNTDTFILTGHQPIFYHPGIIVKNLLLNKIGVGERAKAINLIVDTDNFKELSAHIPAYNNGIKKIKETLLSNPSHTPYEFASAPTWETFQLFAKKIEKNLSHPQFKNLYENFLKFVKAAGEEKRDFKNISHFMTFIRRRYENEVESRYLEAPVSYICDMDEFLIFFISIAKNSERFAQIYNFHLERYRIGHKLRYPANPFPNLKMDGKRFELPFWHFYNNKRNEVFVECNTDEIVILFDDYGDINFKINEIEKGIELIKKGNIKIRPKAISFTLFVRMFISDIFIHGVGGAKYDRITDEIIRDFYEVEPPEFITASLTLFPSVTLKDENHLEKIKELEEKIRDMKYNPDRYIESVQYPLPQEDRWKVRMNEDTAVMLREKEYLLSLLKGAHEDRKDILLKLKKINDTIYQRVKTTVPLREEELNILKRRQKEIEAIQMREYPYFLFSPYEIMKAISTGQ